MLTDLFKNHRCTPLQQQGTQMHSHSWRWHRTRDFRCRAKDLWCRQGEIYLHLG